MKKRLIRAIKSESGQALPIVLVLLVLGGLLIAPTLSYASTSLNAGRIVEKNVNGLYAADAGVEYVLWQITNSIPPLEQQPLPQDVNLMAVDIQTDIIGIYALYYGELVEIAVPHYDWITIDGEMVWVDAAQAYKYTITVTWQPASGDPVIKLEELGVRLPVGYSYQIGSAFIFSATNLSADEPVDTLDEADAHMLNWEFPSPHPDVSEENPTQTQVFYVTGEGDQEGDYAWVVGQPGSIDIVSEVTGGLYRITATATQDGEITAKVMADAMWNATEEEITILLWQINPE